MSTETPQPATPPAGTPDGATAGAGASSSVVTATETRQPGETAAPRVGADSSTAPPRTVRFRPVGLALTVVGLLLVLPVVAAGAWSLVMYLAGAWHHTAHTEPVAPAISLVTDGNVEITVDPAATQVSVQADAWYAWDWQAPTYQATSTADRLEIRHECGRLPISPSCEAGLSVVLPPDTQLEVRAGNGSVVASDLTGLVDVSSADGRVELSRISGDVVAHSGNGRVEVFDVTGSVTASSNDGKVVVSRISGDVIEARSGNGQVEVSDVTGSATVGSNDGKVVVSRISGDVIEARSGNGQVEVSDVTGSATVSSNDGKVVVSGVGGQLIEARSGNGRVEVSDVTGSATVSSNDGAVIVSGVGGDVDAKSGNGKVEVVSVAGSATATSRDGAVLVEDVLGNVTASSGNGSVTVYGTGVPVALDISTGNGRQTIEAATDPAAPTSVSISSRDGSVSYLSPRGPSRVTLPVPDVVGEAQPAASAALERASLGVEVVVEAADVPEGQVLRTDPSAGQRVARGTVVTVVVAAGEGG